MMTDPRGITEAHLSDLSLTKDSPAIGKGCVLDSQYRIARNGVARDMAWDVGAYEYTEESIRLSDDQINRYHAPLPNPMTAGQAKRIVEGQGIRWFSLAGKPVEYQLITSGIYLVTTANTSSLYRIVVTR
jgi:hypothetical protein